jgi:hypothetical protein
MNWIVPRADVERDSTLRRIVDRLEKGENVAADLIALAKHLRGKLTIEVRSTSTST